MENKITIQKENVMQAYNQGTAEQKELLENIFGNAMFQPKDIKERVKTFEGACNELGENNSLVQGYRTASFNTSEVPDIVAYLKLRIICAALNEGWKPLFTEDEILWYPWFRLWTEEELNDKSYELKTDNKLWGFGGSSYFGAACGVSCAALHVVQSPAYALISARLGVKSEELAEYLGKQFIDIWADYLFK